MKTKFACLVAFVVFLTPGLSAQELEAEREPNTSYFTFGFDAMFTSFEKLTPGNIPDVYPVLNDNVYNIAYHIGWRFDRLDIQLGSYFGQNETASVNNANSSRYRHFGFSYAMGYNLMGEESRTRGWFIGPEFVANLQSAQVALSNTPTISSVDQLPNVERYKFTQFSSPLDLGFQFNKMLFSKKDPTSYWLLGLRAGYRLDFDDSWELDSAVPIDYFPVNTRGFYGSFRLGLSF
jgi:hypothetical protein